MKKDTSKQKSPLIADESGNNVGYRDTLDRVAAVLQLLTELDLSDEWSPRAKTGHYLILLILIDTVNYVSDSLGNEVTNE